MDKRQFWGCRKCEICGRRKLPKSDMLLSSFPLNPNRCKLWVKASGNEDLVYLPIEKLHQLKYICGAHFARECFNAKGNRLLNTAVPTLGLTKPPLSDHLFAEFPLHMKYYYDDLEKKKDIPTTNTEMAIDTITDSNISQALDMRGDRVIVSANESCRIDNFVPLPSTSSAPLHLTYEKINEKNTKTESGDILVQSYKRARNSQKPGKVNYTKRETRLLKRLQESRTTLKTIAKSSLNLDKLDSDILKTIVEDAVRNHNKVSHGKRWELKNKTYALSIFKRSPKAYRFIQKMLPLPSTRTLQRILKEIPMEPGIHTKIIQLLSKKAQDMKDEDKYCVLLFDEIALKKRLIYNEAMDKVEGFVDLGTGESMGRRNKIAGHALVFMLQGLRKKYKQPVGHYFVEGTIESEKLVVLIKNIVRAIHEAGFKVVSTVCDQGPTNIGATNLLKKFNGLPSEANYFFVDESKVFIIFDIPHLFKSIRNNFFQAGFMEYKGKKANWCHLKEAEERNRNFLNFKKLTQNVVNPTYKTKMRVKFAAHALSNTMAAVLKMMAWSSSNSEEINETAFIVEEMDKLFDCTNGPASPKDVKKGIRENVSEKTNHEESWNYYLRNITCMKFLKSDSQIRLRNVRCIKGLETSLRSLKDIWHFLNKEVGFKYLNLRQLNQDSLENLFGNIRQHSVTNRNPTCTHFNAALKTSVISGLSGPHSRGSNCEIDFNKLFLSHQEITEKSEPFSEPTPHTLTIQTPENQTENYPVLSLPEAPELENVESSFHNFEEQPIVYVSGYLAAKVVSKFSNCEACKFFIKEENPNLDDPLYKCISLKEWWQDKISLTYPRKELCMLVNEAKRVFERDVLPELHQLNIAQYCSLQLSSYCNMNWFNCSTHYQAVHDYLFSFISKLFIRKLCKIKNNEFAKNENEIADKIKRAQQQNIDK